MHRLGQTRKVFIETLVMRQSVEENIWNLNKEKQSGEGKKVVAGSIRADGNVKLQQSEISKLFQ